MSWGSINAIVSKILKLRPLRCKVSCCFATTLRAFFALLSLLIPQSPFNSNIISSQHFRHFSFTKIVKYTTALGVQIGNIQVVVSVHCLKLAFVGKGTPPAKPVPYGRPHGRPKGSSDIPPPKPVKCTTNAPKRAHCNLRPGFLIPFHPLNLLHQDVPFVSVILLQDSTYSSHPKGLGEGPCGGSLCLV